MKREPTMTDVGIDPELAELFAQEQAAHVPRQLSDDALAAGVLRKLVIASATGAIAGVAAGAATSAVAQTATSTAATNTAAATAGTTATASAAASTAGAVAAAAKGATSWIWLAVAGTAGAVGGGTVVHVIDARPSSVDVPAARPAPAVITPPPPTPVPTPAEVKPPVEPVPQLTTPRSTKTPSVDNVALPPAVTMPPSAFSLEVALIDRARIAISNGALDDAAAALKECASQFPAGTLIEERRRLELEVMALREQWYLLKTSADAYLKSYPAGIHLPRVNALRLQAQSELDSTSR